MAKMRPSLFFVTVISTLVPLTAMVSSKASDATQRKINGICRQLEDRQFCNQTFNNYLVPTIDVGYSFLTGIAITEARKNATNTLGFIRCKIPGEKNPAQLNHYTVCQNAYEILQRSFTQAFEAFTHSQYRDMALYMRDTPRVQASCVTIFTVPPLTENPLNERNREMRILLTMAIVTGYHIVPPIVTGQ